MTRNDYSMVMKKVRIAELKAKLSEHLRAVRRGDSVTVMVRDTPVAVITPFDRGPGALSIRSPSADAPEPGQIELPPPLPLQADIVDLLLEDRRSEQ